ncbi:MAG: UbiD family decarboxylase [Chloroflexi bacterium]|nr:UbiD family decarboxylase [Chloroflexota bacterium]
MPFRDLREFIARLEGEKEAVQIKEEVDWDLEAGAIVRLAHEKGLPAPFFQRVKGYPEGYRMFGAPLATHKRVAIAMDMDADASLRQMIQEYGRRERQPIKPVFVKNGPCKENIYVGEEVDLLKFPVPLLHEGDGGRYIGTFHLTIVKDPDREWVNWSMQRHMVHTRNTMGILAEPLTHLGGLLRKYEERNKPMEVAIAIGTEPVSAFCSASPIPYGVSEVDIAGGIRGEPVELVRCETVDLAVPATSEIVIEGEFRPHERMLEGPFGEYTGYMAGDRAPRPVITAKAITHRNNPILTVTCEGMPLTEGQLIGSIGKTSELIDALKARGLPVTDVCVYAETSPMLAVVAVKVPFANVASEIAHVVWGVRAGAHIAYIIVVEDDVDPYNMSEVLHALVTKCHPSRGIFKWEQTIGYKLFPFLNEHERKYAMGAKAYFDCTWPVDWDPAAVPKKSSFKTIYPAQIQEKALAKWRKYGYAV